MVFEALSNYAVSLAVAATVAIGGMFLKVTGQEIRLVAVEEQVQKHEAAADALLGNQDRMMYKMCLLIHDKDMQKCSGG